MTRCAVARALVHPRLMQQLVNHYAQSVTIQERLETRDSLGQITDVWVTRYIAVDCMIADGQQKENRTATETIIQEDHVIALRGFYPAVDEGMRVIDGLARTFQILRVEHDSQASATYLAVERVI